MLKLQDCSLCFLDYFPYGQKQLISLNWAWLYCTGGRVVCQSLQKRFILSLRATFTLAGRLKNKGGELWESDGLPSSRANRLVHFLSWNTEWCHKYEVFRCDTDDLCTKGINVLQLWSFLRIRLKQRFQEAKRSFCFNAWVTCCESRSESVGCWLESILLTQQADCTLTVAHSSHRYIQANTPVG